MSIIRLIDALNDKTLAPAYLFHGPERFLIDRAVKKIKRIVLSSAMSDFNLHELNGNQCSGDTVVNQAMQIPMMATKSLVIVDDAHKMSADDHRVVDTYLENPSPDTCLVLLADKFEARRGLTKNAAKRGQLFAAEPLKEQDIPPFIKWRAKERHVKIDPGAVAAISAAVGPDCAALDDAVERVGLYAGREVTVTEESVAEVVTSIRQHSIFELVDAVGSGRSDRAFTLLEGLLNRQQEPIMINAMIARHYRQLLLTRIHLHLGTDRSELPRAVGAPPFVVKNLIQQAKRFRGEALERALKRLSLADLELKSSKRPPRVIIEQAVMDLSPSRG